MWNGEEVAVKRIEYRPAVAKKVRVLFDKLGPKPDERTVQEAYADMQLLRNLHGERIIAEEVAGAFHELRALTALSSEYLVRVLGAFADGLGIGIVLEVRARWWLLYCWRWDTVSVHRNVRTPTALLFSINGRGNSILAAKLRGVT